MAANARYHIFAWEDPFVGHDAIRAELLREASTPSNYRVARIDIVAIASVGQIVFTERVDSGTLRGKPYAVHVAGAFEMDAGRHLAGRVTQRSRGLRAQPSAPLSTSSRGR